MGEGITKRIRISLQEDGFSLRMVGRLGGELTRFSSKALMRQGLRKAGVNHATQIFSYTNASELQTLYQLASACPEGGTILEIGSHLGASTCYLGAGIRKRGGMLFCVDTWNNETMAEGRMDTFEGFQHNTAGLRGMIKPIRKRSAELVREDIRSPLDLVFIDGDHTYEAVKGDFETIRPWLADKAVIAFHDTVAFEGVCRVLGEILTTCEFRLVGHISNLSWVERRSPKKALKL